jgi:pimeloyl-ACP methyl ester carboxylesterase
VLQLAFLGNGALAQSDVPRFEQAPCPFAAEGVPDAVECGWLVVSENRAKADGRTLRLSVAVIRSIDENPRPDPLVFLSGGPGQSSVEVVPRRVDHPFWNRYRKERDLVFFDQRGTGYSDPEFCPELDIALYTAGFRGLPVAEQRDFERQAVLECREKMLAAGIDFATYNSKTSAQDLDDLRKVLGYESWNLFGASYGTRLALTAMRDTPDGIRSVVLDSVSPPNSPLADAQSKLMRSLQLVFDRCTADERCRTAFPTIEADFFEVVTALEAQPVVLAMADRNRFPDGRIVIDGTLLLTGVFQGLYDAAFVPFFPLLVRELKAGNVHLLSALARVGDRRDDTAELLPARGRHTGGRRPAVSVAMAHRPPDGRGRRFLPTGMDTTVVAFARTGLLLPRHGRVHRFRGLDRTARPHVTQLRHDRGQSPLTLTPRSYRTNNLQALTPSCACSCRCRRHDRSTGACRPGRASTAARCPPC